MKKVKSKINKAVKDNKAENYSSVLLERMHDDIKLIAEGQIGIQRQFDEFKDEMHEFKDEMGGFKKDMYGFRKETESNFKAVFDYLSRIEDEIAEIKADLKNNYERKGWDKAWRNEIEKRLSKIEKSLTSKSLAVKVR